MDDNERDLKTGVRGLAAEARRSLEEHPLPEELLDYHAGDLQEEDRERIQEHLALCPACVRVLLDLDAFPDVEPVRSEDRLTDIELARAWQRLQRSAAPVAQDRSRIAPPMLALAAVLLLAVVGLSLWVVRLRGEVRGLSSPQAGVLVADLVPQKEAVERAEGGEEVVRVPAWADRILLILNLADPTTHPTYRIEITSRDGREVWSRAGVRRSADGTFALEVPRRFLPAGRYRIRLFGIEGGSELLVAEYLVRIEHT